MAEKIDSKKWKCCSECKSISEGEVNAILCLKAAFDLSVEEVRAALTTCDYGCPFGHYSKQVGSTSLDLKGHPIVCYSGSSQLRILRAASTHFTVLRKFLLDVHCSISSHKCVIDIDEALNAGNYNKLMKVLNINKVESLLSNDVDSKYEHVSYKECCESDLRPDLEMQLMTTHAALMTALDRESYDFPDHACCCCE